MGFQHAAVLAPVSFFLGVLFICLNVDHRILWGKLTDDAISDAFQFYTTFFNAPPAIKGLLHGMMAVGLSGLLYKLNKWDDSAMFFDGSSLAAYVFAVIIYLSVIIPGLQTIVSPTETETREFQIEAIRVSSAGNVIIIACLILILFLQAGQEYATRADAKTLKEFELKPASDEKVKEQ